MPKRPVAWYVELARAWIVAATGIILLIGLHGTTDLKEAMAAAATIAASSLLLFLLLRPRSTRTMLRYLSMTRLLPFLAILVVALHVSLLLLGQRTPSPPPEMPLHVNARLAYGAVGIILLGASALLLLVGLDQIAKGRRTRGSMAVGLAFVIQLSDPALLRVESDISVDPEPFVSAALDYLERDQSSKEDLRETLAGDAWYTDTGLQIEPAGESGAFPLSEYRRVDCGTLVQPHLSGTIAIILIGGVDPVAYRGGQEGFPANNAELGLARAKQARDDCLKEVREQVPVFLLPGTPGNKTVTAYKVLESETRAARDQV